MGNRVGSGLRMLRGGSLKLVSIGKLAGLGVKTVNHQITLIGRHDGVRHQSAVFVDRYTANDDACHTVRCRNGQGAGSGGIFPAGQVRLVYRHLATLYVYPVIHSVNYGIICNKSGAILPLFRFKGAVGTHVQTAKALYAIQQVGIGVIVIPSARSGGSRRRAGSGHEIGLVQGREKLLPRDFRSFNHEIGHRLPGIRGIKILKDNARPVFKTENKVIAAALKQGIASRKIKLDARVFRTLHEDLRSCRRLHNHNVCHDVFPFGLRNEENTKAPFFRVAEKRR